MKSRSSLQDRIRLLRGHKAGRILLMYFLCSGLLAGRVLAEQRKLGDKPRLIVTSDGEIDDKTSMVRFLLYANEWDVEGIITSSSDYHWRGYHWPGDNWTEPYLEGYAKVYPNLIKHAPQYPTPEYLRERTLLGNVDAVGEMDAITAGSQHIVKVLLDESDDRPVWIQAWGGPNTIARALKTIEEEHPEKMDKVADKIRLYLIWEQDNTYQAYIRPRWEPHNILTIISYQLNAICYQWRRILPPVQQRYFERAWLKENILQNHGPLCSLYPTRDDGSFLSEELFQHCVVTGLRNMESPGWGGWGGRYVKVRNNTWLDPHPDPSFQYPTGRSRMAVRRNFLISAKDPADRAFIEKYHKPVWRWAVAFQNDWAARADWCVLSPEKANHPPVVQLGHDQDIKAAAGQRIALGALGTSDPDGDRLSYRWWQYVEPGTYPGEVTIQNADQQEARFNVPQDVRPGQTIHIICEVTDDGNPPLTRYRRVIVTLEGSSKR